MDQTFMAKRKILPLVLEMAFPMALSMLINALYNIVDSFFVAKISEKAMLALSLVFPLQNAASAVAIGFGVGVNALVAYQLGAKNSQKADGAASMGLILSVVHAVILTVGLLLMAAPFLKLFTQDTTVLNDALAYSRIIFSLTIITQIYLVYEKLFQAIGRMKLSMAAMSAGCITNIILDPLMIFGIGFFPKMGITGAAIATMIGQLVSLMIYVVSYRRGGLYGVHLSYQAGIHAKDAIRPLYNVGIPAALTQILPSFLITALNAMLAAFGETSVLILGIYYKLQTFIYLTANGIVQGIRPIIAYNYGAKRFDRVKGIFKTALILSLIVMAVGMAACLIFPDALMRLFVNGQAVVTAGATALRIISCGFLVSAISVTVGGTMEALGKGSASFVISLLRFIAIILPVAYLLSRVFGQIGVWHSFWIAESATAVVAIFIIHKTFKNFDRQPSKKQ